MFTNSKVAFSLALVLATASAALAGPKHEAPQQTTIQQQVPTGAHLNPGPVRPTAPVRSTVSVRSTGPANQPSALSPGGFERLSHLIEAFQDIAFREDAKENLGN
jgi:hypothetical protein